MKQFTSETQKIGKIGEDIAVTFLMKQGYEIIDRNFTQKCGELDIVTKNKGKIHFVEVKTVSCESFYRPEENVSPRKLKRMARAIQIYMAQKRVSYETDWQIDVVTVILNSKNKTAKVDVLENIIIGA
ncbi:MAG TPA: YraN family protein [Candidatus Paceibacterota bacterium]